MTPAADGGSPSTGPPDRRTLRLLERHLAGDPLVAETEFDPNSDEPRELRAHIAIDGFPPSVERVRLDVRWFATDDFSMHYIETTRDDRWECRWDRHPNSHNSRLHFHQPPDGTDATDLELPSLHPIDVLSTVLAAIEERIEQRWETDAAR